MTRSPMPSKPAVWAAMLLLATGVPAAAAQGDDASGWRSDILDQATRSLTGEREALHAQHPDMVPPPHASRAAKEHLVTRLLELAEQVGEGRVRIALDLPPGSEDQMPDDEMVAAARSAYAAASTRAQAALDLWANATLRRPGDPALEDAWFAAQGAFHLLQADLFVDRFHNVPNASAILNILRGVEANLVLLETLQSVWEHMQMPNGESQALTASDVESVFERVRYDPDALGGKIRELDRLARSALDEGNTQLALAYLLTAEMTNTNQRAYNAALMEKYDLLPSLRAEYARWQNATPSLLLQHADESAEAVFAAAPENATAAASNLGLAAGDALARYSAVLLLRGSEASGTGDATESRSQREMPMPLATPAAGLAVAFSLILRRTRDATCGEPRPPTR